jgi:hypothetical protein
MFLKPSISYKKHEKETQGSAIIPEYQGCLKGKITGAEVEIGG